MDELRKCKVKIDGEMVDALFHRWVNIKGVSALVELSDGSIKIVKPTRVVFVKHEEE